MDNQWRTSCDYLSDEAPFLFSKEIRDLTHIVRSLYFRRAPSAESQVLIKRVEVLDQELIKQVESVGITLFSPGGTLPRVLSDVLGSCRDSKVSVSYKTLLESKIFRSKVREFAATLLEANKGATDDLRFGRGWGRFDWRDLMQILKNGKEEDAISLIGPWAEKGDREAIHLLSVLLRHSTIKTNAGLKALELLKVEAEHGDESALSAVCSVLLREQSSYKDYAAAAIWLNRAATHGNSRAYKNLGDLYRYGRGVKRDYKKALHWYMLSTHKSRSACLSIGSMHLLGQGVARNKVSALMWYFLWLNGAKPNPIIGKPWESLQSEMSIQEVEEARALAASWVPGTRSGE